MDKNTEQTKPNEALECLEEIGFAPLNECYGPPYQRISNEYDEQYDIIKNYILKAQEQEKKLNFLEDAMDLPTNCFSTFKNRNGDEVTVMRKEIYEEYCVKEKALKELFENHIELVVEKDRCYFKIKNSKGKEKSFTSYTMLDFWKEVLK